MIILIEEDNGEQYEDYHKWVEKVYIIDTNQTAEQLHNGWKFQIVEIMQHHNITVNPHWLNIMDSSKVKNKKLHTKILKENSFYNWIEKTFYILPQPFATIHL